MSIDLLFQAACAQDSAAHSDGQLLAQFLATRDEAAFAALVRRHGPMVVGVCRRLLGNATDVEDAFQATFLVLIHKAHALAARRVLGDWLHLVARHTALKARVAAARRRAHEQSAARPEAAPGAGDRDEWMTRLDDELRRLPQKYRLPIVLCDLQRKTRREAADQLGWPEGTVAGRLARGRALLAKRLLRAGLPALALANAADGAVRPQVVDALIRAATSGVPSHVLSANALALAHGVIAMMFWTRMRIGACLLLLAALLVGGGGLAMGALADAGPATAPPQAVMPIRPALQGQVQGQNRAAIGKERFALRGHSLNATCVTFAPDKRRLASAGADGTVKIWDIKTGKELLTLRGHDKQVWSAAFHPKREELASAGADGTVRIWDLDEGKELLRYTGHRGNSVHGLAYSPDGKWIASGNASAAGAISVRIWDAATGKEQLVIDGFTGMIKSLAFSPDGTRLASASGDRTIRVWDVTTGKKLVSISLPDSYFESVCFSPDGKRLVSANDDRTATIWDAQEGVALLVLKGHNREVTSAVFSPDGKLVASAGFDATVRLWDATTGKQLDSRGGYEREIHSVAFHPEGTLLATGSADGLVKVWEIKGIRKD